MHFYEKQSQYIKMHELVLVSIVGFIVGNTAEFENVTMNMTKLQKIEKRKKS